MATLAHLRAEANALEITVAVETQLFRWAAEVDRLNALNTKLVEALGLCEKTLDKGASALSETADCSLGGIDLTDVAELLANTAMDTRSAIRAVKGET